MDIGAQLNIWRIIAVSESRAQDIANKVLPGLGYLLAFLVVLGGLAFNIGNIGGAGLGFNVLFGVDPKIGAVVSALVAVGIFLSKEAGKAMDRFALALGFVMIGLTLYVMFTSASPVGEAVVRSFVPEITAENRAGFFMAIVTWSGDGRRIHHLCGGPPPVGCRGEGNRGPARGERSSVSGILIMALMRYILFLAALGVVAAGLTLDEANPPASVFQLAAGEIGYKVFGIVMWAAAVTSVVGAAYTSVSFIRTFSETLDRHHKKLIIAFIVLSTLVFVTIGRPVKTLILVGALNGLILPIALGIMLIAAHRKSIVGDYKHPVWLTFFGVLVVMSYLGGVTLFNLTAQVVQLIPFGSGRREDECRRDAPRRAAGRLPAQWMGSTHFRLGEGVCAGQPGRAEKGSGLRLSAVLRAESETLSGARRDGTRFPRSPAGGAGGRPADGPSQVPHLSAWGAGGGNDRYPKPLGGGSGCFSPRVQLYL